MIVADSDEELLKAAVQHAFAVPHHDDTLVLRDQPHALFERGKSPCKAMQTDQIAVSRPNRVLASTL